ncbi:GNAT family N-acetyltransferase [Pseudonocardia endophytica]|uniref:Ribosomal protein S18 acetylase RimI-like enzyme n=1 Tax=Pseudonocardia endophytica TaxID=401976 RepID=A0A4R1HVQ4_PSEEN|nr:GNAT family N-acetyltransferase [Pseudonocardia endophytica]TCK25503.1 ribosomal protein S18 acetylase RimI-like enzyme [Pseudonocardia endophytica]
MLELRVASLDHPHAVALNDEVQAYYARVYGEVDLTRLETAQFLAPRGTYLIGYDDGVPVVSGAWRSLDPAEAGGDPVRDGDAEIKRMYVVPAARGLGYARALLAGLERTAVEQGRTRMILETGTAQPDAIALYRSSGYEAIAVFGEHRGDERSRCFAKPLVPAPAP